MILAVSASLVACSQEATETKQEEIEKLPIEVIKATTSDMVSYSNIVGEAQAIQSVSITPQLQGEVTEIYVNIGDRLKAEDKLFSLDTATLEVQVQQAKAGLQSAEANLAKALKGTRKEQLAQLKAQLEQAKSAYEQAEKAYQRQKKLYEREIISKQQLESIQNQYIAAKSGYEAAAQNLKMAEEGATIEDIQAIKAQVSQARAAFKSAQLRLEKAEVTTPISGILASINIEAGEMAGMQPVAAVVNLDQVKVVAYISETNVNKIQAGEEVTVNFNALEKEFRGRIKSISPVMDARKKAFPVEVVVDNQDHLIKAGMYAEINFITNQIKDQIVIPQASVLEEAGEEYVYIFDGKKAVKRRVESGLSNGSRVVIVEGIDLGEEVVIKGQEKLRLNIIVEVVNRGDQ